MKKHIIIIVGSIIALILFIYLFTKKEVRNVATKVEIKPTKPQTFYEYGLDTVKYNITKFSLEKGKTFADILHSLGYNSKQTHLMASKAKDVMDLHKMKIGDVYATVRLRNNKDGIADFFVYEPSPKEYVKFSFEKDSLVVKKTNRKLIKKTKTVSAVIESSLWNAMTGNGYDPVLAVKISDIFAWSIDFFGLQKGDKFKLIYEEIRVEGNNEWHKIGNIEGAVFTHLGKDYYAYLFANDTINSYFNEKGQNLKQHFLKAPLKYSRISSHFTNSRFHPVLKIYRPHHGVDYAAPRGTPVHTVANGVVILKINSKSGGKMLEIKHDKSYVTSYMHLSKFAKGIEKGVRVTQGETIGYVGSTGISTGPHLDFRFYRNGKAIDPLKVVGPPAKALPERLKLKFNTIKTNINKKLGIKN